LWDALAAEFLERYNNRTDFGPFVVIMNHARVKEAQGTYHIGTEFHVVDGQLSSSRG
jgi:hypothetical protein